MSKEDEEKLSEFRRVLEEYAFVDVVTVDFDESLQAYVFKVSGLRRKTENADGDLSIKRIRPFHGFTLLNREAVICSAMSTKGLVDECLKDLYASVNAEGKE